MREIKLNLTTTTEKTKKCPKANFSQSRFLRSIMIFTGNNFSDFNKETTRNEITEMKEAGVHQLKI